jgi:hypothetical protein
MTLKRRLNEAKHNVKQLKMILKLIAKNMSTPENQNVVKDLK